MATKYRFSDSNAYTDYRTRRGALLAFALRNRGEVSVIRDGVFTDIAHRDLNGSLQVKNSRSRNWKVYTRRDLLLAVGCCLCRDDLHSKIDGCGCPCHYAPSIPIRHFR